MTRRQNHPDETEKGQESCMLRQPRAEEAELVTVGDA